jgi:hypothetical protein
MPPLTGYESEDEWQRRTNANYGREWRNGLGMLGMVVGPIIAAVILFNHSQGMPLAKVRLLAGLVIAAGMVVGVLVGLAVGSVLDETINPRTRRKRGEVRVRIRGRGKKRRIDMD